METKPSCSCQNLMPKRHAMCPSVMPCALCDPLVSTTLAHFKICPGIKHPAVWIAPQHHRLLPQTKPWHRAPSRPLVDQTHRAQARWPPQCATWRMQRSLTRSLPPAHHLKHRQIIPSAGCNRAKRKAQQATAAQTKQGSGSKHACHAPTTEACGPQGFGQQQHRALGQ